MIEEKNIPSVPMAFYEADRQLLASILNATMDGIVIINRKHYITMFNHAAEQIFRCAAAWAIGQPFDRFMSPKSKKLLESLLCKPISEGNLRQQIWAPEGLIAVRANGEEFPIEATVSSFQTDKGLIYVIILRDVNQRAQAEGELHKLQIQHLDMQEEFLRQHSFHEIIGNSPALRAVLDRIEVVAQTDSTVLLIGETGTGKELFARAIHKLSNRRHKMLVTVNCAALPGELIESELFGHERGSFTGATNQRKGRFEVANQGTIFLDEAGELSQQAQAKLLRVLQDGTFNRVGGETTIRSNARVIAATNRDLAGMVEAGLFRADLYYRLNVFPVRVPPLKERMSDIPPLTQYFLRQAARRLGKTLHGLHPTSMERLMQYEWPGNIRELQNIIERAAILTSGPILTVHDALINPASSQQQSKDSELTLWDAMKEHIENVLAQTDWIIEGKQGAARKLGLNPSTLRYRMRLLNIHRKKR